MTNDNAASSIDAYSVSPSLRLRYQILAAKAADRPPCDLSPPPVGEQRHALCSDADAVARAFRDNHSLAALMRMRADAAVVVEHLIAFLDETDGLADDEDSDEDGDISDSPSDLETDNADDEPWLGSPEIAPSFQIWHERYRMWLTRQGDQEHWAAGAADCRECEPEHDEDTNDREAENEDGDGNAEDEPSLGWTEGEAARGRGYAGSMGRLADLEIDAVLP